MAKNQFDEAYFLKLGYTSDGKGGFIPPKFRHPLINKPIKDDGTFTLKIKNSDLYPFGVMQGIVLDEFTFLGKRSKPIAVFNVDPIGKPRMTQQDKWRTDPNHINPKSRQRKNVGLYWKYKAKLVEQALVQNFIMPECDYHLIAFIPMPHSWNEKKKAVMNMSPHKQKPDKDNIEKGFLDSLMKDDSSVWDGRVTKYWARTGKMLIYLDK